MAEATRNEVSAEQPNDCEEEEEAALALASQQKPWRWLPFRSAGPSGQSWRRTQSPSPENWHGSGWSPFQCLPAVHDLVRLRQSRTNGSSSGLKKECRAIRSPSKDAKSACEPLILNIKETGPVVEVDPKETGPAVDQVLESSMPRVQTTVPLREAVVAIMERCGDGNPLSCDECTSPAESPIVHTEIAEDALEDVLTPVVLDVGFAQVELKKKQQMWPKYEFYILAKDGILTRDGAVALLEYLDFVLHLPDVVLAGFVLTYDMRDCVCPQLDLVSWIMHYISEPHREDAWHERCVCWKVVVPEGVYFTMAESVLAFLFRVCPPKCRVFLVTDLETSNTQNWICYRPEDSVEAEPNMLTTWSAGLLEAFFPPHPHTCPPAPMVHEVVCTEQAFNGREIHKELVDTAALNIETTAVAVDASLSVCADSLTTDFAIISQGFNQATNTGFLKIMGLDAPTSDEGLTQLMEFMDDFVNSANAQQGYSITYDLRSLSIPSMTMVMRVAEWGNEPGRQAKWNRLNTSCKVVVASGFRFSICKGVLKSFFYVCPPVCQTFLLTDPDEPEDTALSFGPPVAPTDKQEEEDSAHSDDGGSSEQSDSAHSGQSADASETTSASSASACSEEAADVRQVVAICTGEQQNPEDCSEAGDAQAGDAQVAHDAAENGDDVQQQAVESSRSHSRTRRERQKWDDAGPSISEVFYADVNRVMNAFR